MAERKPYFVLKNTNDSKEPFMFNLHAPNGEPIATSGGERYTTKAAALNGIKSVKENAPKAEIRDETK